MAEKPEGTRKYEPETITYLEWPPTMNQILQVPPGSMTDRLVFICFSACFLFAVVGISGCSKKDALTIETHVEFVDGVPMLVDVIRDSNSDVRLVALGVSGDGLSLSTANGDSIIRSPDGVALDLPKEGSVLVCTVGTSVEHSLLVPQDKIPKKISARAVQQLTVQSSREAADGGE